MPFFSFLYNAIISCSFRCHELDFFFIAAVNWTGEHHAFIVEMFIKTNESITATQRAFRSHFNLGIDTIQQPLETRSSYGLPTLELLDLH